MRNHYLYQSMSNDTRLIEDQGIKGCVFLKINLACSIMTPVESTPINLKVFSVFL